MIIIISNIKISSSRIKSSSSIITTTNFMMTKTIQLLSPTTTNVITIQQTQTINYILSFCHDDVDLWSRDCRLCQTNVSININNDELGSQVQTDATASNLRYWCSQTTMII